MAQITLKPITKENWQQATKLEVHESQKNFVAPNWYSIIQALFEGFESRGIYLDDAMVGYTMFGHDDEGYWIDRLMIAKDHQGKGYGRIAMKHILSYFENISECKEVFISFEPENKVAQKLYESLGFEDTGRVEHGELIFRKSMA